MISILNKKKIINDPVYGFINIPNEEIFDLIEHRYVQRLRRILQLGQSNLVYPGAQHTRFSHALGAMYLMNQALDVLRQKGAEIEQQEFNATLSAILLHDIGHGPFSHCLEHFFFSASHEKISSELMKRIGVSQKTLEIFSNTYSKKFLHQLVSSQVDTDRLDYLTRDSFFTGVSEGVIGTERIIKMFSLKDDELVIEQKGIYSIEKFIISRRLMYWQVYMHKSVVASDCLLKNILKRAYVLEREKKLFTDNISSSISFAFRYFIENGATEVENDYAIEMFTLLDDSDILSAVKIWTMHHDEILSYLSKCLINRRIGKVVIQDTPFEQDVISQQIIKSRFTNIYGEEIVREYFFFDDELKNKAYSFQDDKINILLKNGQVKEICNASDQLDETFLRKEIKKYFLYQVY